MSGSFVFFGATGCETFRGLFSLLGDLGVPCMCVRLRVSESVITDI